MLEGLNAINEKVDNANLTLGDFAASKNKIAVENSDLLRIVGDLDNNLNILAKQKAALAAQLNDVKALCDNEARERGLLLGKYRNLEHELDGAREALDEEGAGRENTLRLCAKAEAESQCWRQKYETDAVAKGEELEMTRLRRPRARLPLRATTWPTAWTRPRSSMPPWRGRPSSLTRSSASGKVRLTACRSTLTLARRRLATPPLSCSR